MCEDKRVQQVKGGGLLMSTEPLEEDARLRIFFYTTAERDRDNDNDNGLDNRLDNSEAPLAVVCG